MSKTVSAGLAPSATLFSRLLDAIDRVLMASANAAVRTATCRVSASKPLSPVGTPSQAQASTD